MRPPLLFVILFFALVLGAVFVLALSRAFEVNYEALLAGSPISTSTPPIPKKNPNADIEPQRPLENPPEVVNAIYLTSWAASTNKFVDYAIDLAANTEINAVVLDIKDYSGLVAYDTDIEAVNLYETEEIRISKPNALIKKFHDAGIYAIARISVFQDPAFAKARPDLAVQSIIAASSTGNAEKSIWRDRKGLLWMDPASHEVWDYNISIANDAAARGFDEINFDYIRFPSDGSLGDMRFLFLKDNVSKASVIRDFFAHLRNSLQDTKISADLFGLTTIAKDDMGIGQIIENAYSYFDFVAPMVYPSHYGVGALGFASPAEHPYEIVRGSLDSAYARLKEFIALQNSTSSSLAIIGQLPVARLRPWLQDFSLGITYDAEKVRAQIQATRDSLGSDFSGFMLWSPSNRYSRGALGAN